MKDETATICFFTSAGDHAEVAKSGVSLRALAGDHHFRMPRTIMGVLHREASFGLAEGTKLGEVVCAANLAHMPSATLAELPRDLIGWSSRDADGNLMFAQ